MSDEDVSIDFQQLFCITKDGQGGFMLEEADWFNVYDDDEDIDQIKWEEKHWLIPVYSKDEITFKYGRGGFTLSKTYTHQGGFSMRDMYKCLEDWVTVYSRLDWSWAFGGLNKNDDGTFTPCFDS